MSPITLVFGLVFFAFTLLNCSLASRCSDGGCCSDGCCSDHCCSDDSCDTFSSVCPSVTCPPCPPCPNTSTSTCGSNSTNGYGNENTSCCCAPDTDGSFTGLFNVLGLNATSLSQLNVTINSMAEGITQNIIGGVLNAVVPGLGDDLTDDFISPIINGSNVAQAIGCIINAISLTASGLTADISKNSTLINAIKAIIDS